MRNETWAAIALLACLLGGAPALAQVTGVGSAPRAQVLFLGTYHFDNPGLDVVKTEVADVLAPAKQAEIAGIVKALARFKPTRIAVEARTNQAARLDSLYAAFRAGRHTLGKSEVQQLGFRLAAQFGHERLYPIDHAGEFPFGEVMQYAQQHDTAFVQRAQQFIADITSEQTKWQREKTIGEILRLENDPQRIAWGQGFYMGLARVGAGDTYVGADLVAKWYARNIRIFSDVQKLAQPGERILVIFGAGHAAIVRELIKSDPNLELVEATGFLGS
jgi:hypothetical protein